MAAFKLFAIIHMTQCKTLIARFELEALWYGGVKTFDTVLQSVAKIPEVIPLLGVERLRSLHTLVHRLHLRV